MCLTYVNSSVNSNQALKALYIDIDLAESGIFESYSLKREAGRFFTNLPVPLPVRAPPPPLDL
jgi:hypothetical protein